MKPPKTNGQILFRTASSRVDPILQNGLEQPGKDSIVSLLPVEIFGGIVIGPKLAFFLFTMKFRDLLWHRSLSLFCSYHGQKLHEFCRFLQ